MVNGVPVPIEEQQGPELNGTVAHETKDGHAKSTNSFNQQPQKEGIEESLATKRNEEEKFKEGLFETREDTKSAGY